MKKPIDVDKMLSRVEGSIAARKCADELLQLAISESNTHPYSFDKQFSSDVLSRLRDSLNKVLDEKPKPDRAAPMNYEEAQSWERKTKLRFGQYEGLMIKDVPLDYLLWMAGDKFVDELRRYLGSPQVKQQQPEPDDDVGEGDDD